MAESLFQQLRRHGAPSRNHDHFVVGRLESQLLEIKKLVADMVNSDEGSQLRLILGPNGNGKTLLNRAAMLKATETNLKTSETDGRKRVEDASFNVLFSHITARGSTSVASKLVSNLRRSIYEPKQTTFALIAAEIFRKYAEDYEVPLVYRIFPSISKGLVSRAMRYYEETLPDLITYNEKDIEDSLDDAMQDLQKALSSWSTRAAFKKFANSHEFGEFLKEYAESSDRPLTTSGLYDSVRRALESKGGVEAAVETMAAIAQDVDCKLLMAMVDDCNTTQTIEDLLPIAEKLEDFKTPKLLLIVTAVDTNWQIIEDASTDKTISDRFVVCGKPITVYPPNEGELDDLARKLRDVANQHYASSFKRVEIGSDDLHQLAQGQLGKSFREATQAILRDFATRAK